MDLSLVFLKKVKKEGHIIHSVVSAKASLLSQRTLLQQRMMIS